MAQPQRVACGNAARSPRWRRRSPSPRPPAARPPTARCARPSRSPPPAAGSDVQVRRVFLTDETIENGVRDGMALVVELAVTNHDTIPYGLPPTGLWCLMQVDARRPAETRLLPPSMNGDGAFPGALARGGGPQVDRRRARADAIVLGALPRLPVRRQRRPAPDHARRCPTPRGDTLEVVLADPARGDLRWNVTPTHSTWTVGVQGGIAYGSYVQAMAFSERVSRLATAGRFLWDAGLVSTTLVQVKGALRSTSSSFTGLGVDAHLTCPLLALGRPGLSRAPRALPRRPDPDVDRHPADPEADVDLDAPRAATRLRPGWAGDGPRVRRRRAAERGDAVPAVAGGRQPAAALAASASATRTPGSGTGRPTATSPAHGSPGTSCARYLPPDFFSRWPPNS